MKTLDCTGYPCPKPVMLCKEVLQQEHPETLSVLVDNEAASENVSRFLGKNGYETSVTKEQDALWRITAHGKGCSCTVEEEPAPTGKTVVLLTTETLGRGDDFLGQKLMENFIATLPEMDTSLWMVILLNGGVKLAAQEGKALEGLKALEAAGKKILVCGTCLNHYQLLAEKKVGETTNMLDIVSCLTEATKVIRP